MRGVSRRTFALLLDGQYRCTCPVCSPGEGFRNESASLPISFSPKALMDGLRAIYNKDINVRTEIERSIFDETLKRFNEATAQGLAESIDPAIITDRFLYELRTNNSVFSAFKTHRMQNDVAAQLIDPITGRLKSFDQWKRDVKGITDHYCTQWLQTEYDTAVIRAHQAADWKHFLDEADVLPNIRWMPTTSIMPDPLHQHYWEKKLTLPVNHPFWQEHRPGDRWNCKCSLQQTDEPVNAEALDGYTPPLPMPGLDNNPANDGKLFSDTHPYYTEAYPGAQQAVDNFLKKRSPSSMKRTEDEKAEIMRRWEERKSIRENEKALSKELGIPIPKKPMTFEEADNDRSNPHFGEGKDREYMVNCQCCVVAHELRMRGWDVEAMPNYRKGVPFALSKQTELAFIDRHTNTYPVVKIVKAETSKDVINKFVSTVKTPGRYHIRYDRTGGGGHIITFEVKEDGTYFFYDPQIKYSKPRTPEEFYSFQGYCIDTRTGIEYYRVDNLNISLQYGAKSVKKKP